MRRRRIYTFNSLEHGDQAHASMTMKLPRGEVANGASLTGILSS
jgi:hypothetical protein